MPPPSRYRLAALGRAARRQCWQAGASLGVSRTLVHRSAPQSPFEGLIRFDQAAAPKAADRTVPAAAAPRCLLAPVHYEPNYAYPLLVWLHGHGEDERELLQVMPRISLRNYVSVAPRGLPRVDHRGARLWTWPDSPKTVLAAEQRVYDAIAVAAARYRIHEDRIFLAGQGRGGSMALGIALGRPGRFAGAASLGGPLPARKGLFREYDMARGLPLFVGTSDGPDYTSDRLEADVRLLHAAGARATVFRYLRQRELPHEVLADLNRWMMRIVCGQPQESPRF